MLFVALASLGSASLSHAMAPPLAPPVVIPLPDSDPPKEILDPPPSETIADIERLRLAEPWRFEPSGVLKTPSVELANVSCVKTAFRHFACNYNLRVRVYGETEFGEWESRRKVFTQLGSDWVMLDDEKRCSSIDPNYHPTYCFPKD